jgi:hypothetical protein
MLSLGQHTEGTHLLGTARICEFFGGLEVVAARPAAMLGVAMPWVSTWATLCHALLSHYVMCCAMLCAPQGEKPPEPDERTLREPDVAAGVMELQQLGLVGLLMQQHGVVASR